MPEGKAPRILIADGDQGPDDQVHWGPDDETRTLRGRAKADAIKHELQEHMPPKNARKRAAGGNVCRWHWCCFFQINKDLIKTKSPRNVLGAITKYQIWKHVSHSTLEPKGKKAPWLLWGPVGEGFRDCNSSPMIHPRTKKPIIIFHMRFSDVFCDSFERYVQKNQGPQKTSELPWNHMNHFHCTELGDLFFWVVKFLNFSNFVPRETTWNHQNFGSVGRWADRYKIFMNGVIVMGAL